MSYVLVFTCTNYTTVLVISWKTIWHFQAKHWVNQSIFQKKISTNCHNWQKQIVHNSAHFVSLQQQQQSCDTKRERERVVLLNKHSQQAVTMEVVGNKCTGTIAVYIYSLCRWKCRNLNLALKIHAILKKAHHLNVVSRGPPLFFFFLPLQQPLLHQTIVLLYIVYIHKLYS